MSIFLWTNLGSTNFIGQDSFQVDKIGNQKVE